MKKTAILSVIAILGAAGAAAAGELSLPKNYENWAKSKPRIETDKKSIFYGIHYIYANKKALKAYKSGGPYPEGSRFIAVNYAIKDQNGTKVPGKKSMIVMMERDKAKAETGGWHFAGFTPEGKPSGLDGKRDCFGCHEKQAADRHFVISRYVDFR